MSKKAVISLITLGLILIVVSSASALGDLSKSPALITAAGSSGFTYQGYLEDAGIPVNAGCDFQFSLFSDSDGSTQVGDTQYHDAVNVDGGLFTIPDLDFGWNVFTGQARYLLISVRCPAGEGEYSDLFPLQPLSPAPYALALPGLYTTPGDESFNIIGGASQNLVKGGVFGGTISGGGVSWGYNHVYDHVGTVGGGANNRVGSDDADFWNSDGATVSGGWDNTASGSVSTIGGGGGNSAGAFASTVAGGWENTALSDHDTVAGGGGNTASGGSATVGGGGGNSATGPYSTIAGGGDNIVANNNSTVGGGWNNEASAGDSTVAGGNGNMIDTDAWAAAIGGGWGNYVAGGQSTIGGGDQNAIWGGSSTISGGYTNTIVADAAVIAGGMINHVEGWGGSVSGGLNNQVSGFVGSVVGGENNSASGDHSLAAGLDSHALHNGSFVWSDQSGAFSSTADNQFNVQATGGVNFNTGAAPFLINGASPGPYANVVVVAKSGGDYTSIQAALNSITDAADVNRYLVWVAPGVYSERVWMKPFVDIEGAGRGVTTITFTGSSYVNVATLQGADHAELRNITVENTGDDLYAIPVYSNSSLNLNNVSIRSLGGENWDYGINCSSCFSSLHDVSIDVSGTQNVTGLDIYAGQHVFENVSIFVSGELYVFGIDTNMGSSFIIKDTAISASGGDDVRGIYSDNGASLDLHDSSIFASDGTNVYGILSSYSSIDMDSMVISVSEGITSTTAMKLSSNTVTMRNSEIRSTGDTDNYGLDIIDTAPAELIMVFNSQIIASDNTVYCSFSSCGVYLGSVFLSGKTVIPASGTIECAGVYDENFTFYPDACP